MSITIQAIQPHCTHDLSKNATWFQLI